MLSILKARLKEFFCFHANGQEVCRYVIGATLGMGGKPTLLIGMFMVCPRCGHVSFYKFFYEDQEICREEFPDYFEDDELWPVDPETGEPLEVGS